MKNSQNKKQKQREKNQTDKKPPKTAKTKKKTPKNQPTPLKKQKQKQNPTKPFKLLIQGKPSNICPKLALASKVIKTEDRCTDVSR